MKDKSVKEIKEIIENISTDEYMKYIEILKIDERKSVQSLAVKMAKKLDAIRREEERLEKINEFESEGYKKGYVYIGGIDEAGRGPLAGPVVASVVVFKQGTKIEGINDSKKLSEAKREELFDIIKKEALDYGIGIVNNEEIDEFNILNATYMAMKKALNCLKKSPDYLLIDAATIPGVDIAQNPIIKGDSKSISIAAASILAKVTRDNLMYQYDEMYPEYGFKGHKGYGTKEHYEAIEKHGITPIHRKSFLKNVL
ncbi:ribonuclease HII [Romboutsia sp. 1001713B170131_170501_G6]|uniref:ribonuclease HII n=1 Tax=Romboutsia sp. 1001713B170131_170501_G6 TaxID=2787108 RepID=UPI0018AA4506|nr:ribonuclease HII [Romboutsia sp. 1001713B170131_170501_G6]